MGDLIEPPMPTGGACPTCWGVGKAFGNVDPPKYVNVLFHNVQNNFQSCAIDWKPPIPPVPPTVSLVLTQRPEVPCEWVSNRLFLNYGWVGAWRAHLGSLMLGRRRSGINCDGFGQDYFDYLFLDNTQDPCSIIFTDNQYYQGHYDGHGGYGEVSWPAL